METDQTEKDYWIVAPTLDEAFKWAKEYYQNGDWLVTGVWEMPGLLAISAKMLERSETLEYEREI